MHIKIEISSFQCRFLFIYNLNIKVNTIGRQLWRKYKGEFGPSQSSELQISEKSTDQESDLQGQQPATQVVVTGIEENDVASDCGEEYIEDSDEKTEEPGRCRWRVEKYIALYSLQHDLDNIALERLLVGEGMLRSDRPLEVYLL